MAMEESDYETRQAAESEQALLGALMYDFERAWPQVRDIVSEPDFARPDHRLIFGAILSLIELGERVDDVLVIDRLSEQKQLEAAGGQEYIADLVEKVTSAASAAAYARTVRKFAGRAKVIEIGTRMQAQARLGAPEDAAAHAQAELERIQREQAPPPERRPMRWADLDFGEPAPRTWHIAHWLTSGPTLLAGVGGVGKTLIAQTIATALALGRGFIDEIAEPVTVLMWACEDDHDELWRRQIAICAYFKVPLSALDGKLIIEPRLGMENTLYDAAYGAAVWTPLRKELVSQVNDYRARVLFLDNIGQTFGGKESDRHQVTRFVNGLMGVAPNFAPIIMGHPSKSADSEFSGSTAWENAVRMRWYMGYKLPDQRFDEEEAEDPKVRFFAKRKANYSGKDYRKLEFRDGLFVPESSQMSFAQRWSGVDRKQGAEDCVMSALAQIVRAGIRATDGKTSPDYLPKKMREMQLAGDFTSRELGVALSSLRLAGKITEGVVAKYGNRTSKTGLLIAQEASG